ncbi:hypothetical protein [Nostoc linckia]|nr:hypothetical protein [Nostoc linckia]
MGRWGDGEMGRWGDKGQTSWGKGINLIFSLSPLPLSLSPYPMTND